MTGIIYGIMIIYYTYSKMFHLFVFSVISLSILFIQPLQHNFSWSGDMQTRTSAISYYDSKIRRQLKYMYGQTCVKQAPMGKPKTGCLKQVLA